MSVNIDSSIVNKKLNWIKRIYSANEILRLFSSIHHTVYPVTPNAGMFYQRGYKHLRRGNTQGKKTCNSRISIVPISNITFQTLCKRAFLRNNGASKR